MATSPTIRDKIHMRYNSLKQTNIKQLLLANGLDNEIIINYFISPFSNLTLDTASESYRVNNKPITLSLHKETPPVHLKYIIYCQLVKAQEHKQITCNKI